MAACGCFARAQHDLSDLQSLRMRSLAVCHARRDVCPRPSQLARQWVGPFMWASAGLVGAALLSPGPAEAHESKPWMPRRHYRGLKEVRKPPEFEVSLHCCEAAESLIGTMIRCFPLTLTAAAEESDMGAEGRSCAHARCQEHRRENV
jgi:hypothetical protein